MTKFLRRDTRLLFAGIMALVIVVSGCAKKFDSVDGQFVVVNASAGLGPVDIYLDDVKFNSSPIAYPNNSGYKPVSMGMHSLLARESGLSAVLSQGNLNVIGNIGQSLFFYGSPSSLHAFAVTDNYPFVYDTTKAYVRFFHLSSGTSSLSLGTTNGANFQAVYDDRKFDTNDSAVVHSQYKSIAPGNHSFVLQEYGAPSGYDTLITALAAGKLYTIYSHGINGNQAMPVKISLIQNN
jgi:hypothetical protein